MSVREVLDELALVGDVVLAQKEAGLEEDEVIESLFQSWRGRFETMAIDPQDVAAIICAVSAGPWKNDQRKALASTIMQQQRVVAQNDKWLRIMVAIKRLRFTEACMRRTLKEEEEKESENEVEAEENGGGGGGGGGRRKSLWNHEKP